MSSTKLVLFYIFLLSFVSPLLATTYGCAAGVVLSSQNFARVWHENRWVVYKQ